MCTSNVNCLVLLRKQVTLVIGSDRGLAGAYNSSIIRQLVNVRLNERHKSKDEYVILAIGRVVT